MTADGGRGGARPVVLLDVDGVLNAVAADPDRSTWPDWVRASATADGVRWPLLFSPSVMRAVTRWTEVADVRWLTTWGHQANVELRLVLGLPSLPVFARPPDRDASPDSLSAAEGPGCASEGQAHADLAAASPAHLPTSAPHSGEQRAPDEWWKLTAVRQGLTSGDLAGRAVLWIDDDLAGQPRARRLMDDKANRLVLAPPRRLGLTPRLLREADAFLSQHSQSPGTDGSP